MHEGMVKMVAKRANVALGEFLRSRRGEYRPEQLQFPTGGRRRVPGIRREELALLAGVSASYYTRVEQGAVNASPSVLDAIATALGLSDEDRGQMHRLAQQPVVRLADAEHAELLEPSLRRVLDHVDNLPVGVLGRGMAVLGWNRLGHLVFADHLPFEAPATGRVNWASLLFVDPVCRQRFVNWEVHALDIVGRLRISAALHPEDEAIASVVADLIDASEAFARLWHSHPVRQRSLGVVELAHPSLGRLTLRDSVLRPAENDDQLLIAFVPDDRSTSDVLAAHAPSRAR